MILLEIKEEKRRKRKNIKLKMHHFEVDELSLPNGTEYSSQRPNEILLKCTGKQKARV